MRESTYSPLHDDAFYAGFVQQSAEQQTCRASANDADLSALLGCFGGHVMFPIDTKHKTPRDLSSMTISILRDR
jgi:hypothetical protein